MLLQRGEVIDCDFDRDGRRFHDDQPGDHAISSAATNGLEGMRDMKPNQRLNQFLRLRDATEKRACRKFSETSVETKGPMVLRSNDFRR